MTCSASSEEHEKRMLQTKITLKILCFILLLFKTLQLLQKYIIVVKYNLFTSDKVIKSS
jgi:hypothetical protein